MLNPKHHNEKINPNNLYTLINAKKAKMDDYLSTKRKVTRSKREYTLKILITVHDQHLYEPIGIKELATIFALKI